MRPYLPPTIVLAVQSPALESFRTALKTYVDQTQPFRKELEAESITLTIQMVAVPRVPSVLLETLPQLPQQVEFAFSGRTPILRDVDADVVVDFTRPLKRSHSPLKL